MPTLEQPRLTSYGCCACEYSSEKLLSFSGKIYNKLHNRLATGNLCFSYCSWLVMWLPDSSNYSSTFLPSPSENLTNRLFTVCAANLPIIAKMWKIVRKYMYMCFSFNLTLSVFAKFLQQLFWIRLLLILSFQKKSLYVVPTVNNYIIMYFLDNYTNLILSTRCFCELFLVVLATPVLTVI